MMKEYTKNVVVKLRVEDLPGEMIADIEDDCLENAIIRLDSGCICVASDASLTTAVKKDIRELVRELIETETNPEDEDSFETLNRTRALLARASREVASHMSKNGFFEAHDKRRGLAK